LRVIPPIEITDEKLTSPVPEPDPAAGEVTWSGATAYNVGDEVILTSTHLRYECLVAHSNRNPATDMATPPAWLVKGPTNRMAMFDLLRNTQTEFASPLTVTVTPGRRANSIAMLGLVADTAAITVKSGGAVVYSHTETLLSRQSLGWYDFFYGEFTARPSMVLWNLPPFTDAEITITLTRAAGPVKCGACVFGTYEYIGEVQYDAESDTLNFSKIDRKFDGTAELKPRRNVPKTNQTLLAEKSRTNKIRALRDRLNATPAVWSGLDDDQDGYFEALFILGIYKRFSINLAHATNTVISLELEEI
jgi:hypothetical protein